RAPLDADEWRGARAPWAQPGAHPGDAGPALALSRRLPGVCLSGTSGGAAALADFGLRLDLIRSAAPRWAGGGRDLLPDVGSRSAHPGRYQDLALDVLAAGAHALADRKPPARRPHHRSGRWPVLYCASPLVLSRARRR